MLRLLSLLFAAGMLLASFQMLPAADVDPYDQSKVPLEVQPTDPKAAKILLIAGTRSHGPGDHEFFAGSALLMKLLQQTPGVAPVMARDGWPKNPETFENTRAVVFYMDGRGGHPILKNDHAEIVHKLINKGVGFVCLHYAVDYPKENADLVLPWLGGFYENNWSINPHWTADFKSLPDHPITRGVKPFKLNDEWYYNMRWTPGMKGVTPILMAVPPDATRRTEETKRHPGREEICAWAFDRLNGGRSFGFTGAHFHRNWGDPDFRRLVVNGILWSANVDVPSTGAPVELDPADLNRNLDTKPQPKPKAKTADKK